MPWLDAAITATLVCIALWPEETGKTIGRFVAAIRRSM